jgi:hypothetical protein
LSRVVSSLEVVGEHLLLAGGADQLPRPYQTLFANQVLDEICDCIEFGEEEFEGYFVENVHEGLARVEITDRERRVVRGGRIHVRVSDE